ncbi:hypothetical protein X975_15733, partial [Stegodyphus mimosarum]
MGFSASCNERKRKLWSHLVYLPQLENHLPISSSHTPNLYSRHLEIQVAELFVLVAGSCVSQTWHRVLKPQQLGPLQKWHSAPIGRHVSSL